MLQRKMVFAKGKFILETKYKRVSVNIKQKKIEIEREGEYKLTQPLSRISLYYRK